MQTKLEAVKTKYQVKDAWLTSSIQNIDEEQSLELTYEATMCIRSASDLVFLASVYKRAGGYSPH